MANFLLLREDVVAPLRSGIQVRRARASHAPPHIAHLPLLPRIQALRDGTLHDRDMHVYSDVELVSLQVTWVTPHTSHHCHHHHHPTPSPLVSLQCGSRGVLYRVRLRTAANVDWRRTTRLAYGSLLDWVTPQTPHPTPHIPLYRYGSLLALSHDGFESITWATVASREPSLLVGDTPSVDISFPEVRHLATSKTLAQHRHVTPDPSRPRLPISTGAPPRLPARAGARRPLRPRREPDRLPLVSPRPPCAEAVTMGRVSDDAGAARSSTLHLSLTPLLFPLQARPRRVAVRGQPARVPPRRRPADLPALAAHGWRDGVEPLGRRPLRLQERAAAGRGADGAGRVAAALEVARAPQGRRHDNG